MTVTTLDFGRYAYSVLSYTRYIMSDYNKTPLDIKVD